jgi:hypothetical protein
MKVIDNHFPSLHLWNRMSLHLGINLTILDKSDHITLTASQCLVCTRYKGEPRRRGEGSLM